MNLSVHQISPKPLPLESWNSHIVHVLPRQRTNSFQNQFYCPFYSKEFSESAPSRPTPNIALINMGGRALPSGRSICIIVACGAVTQLLERATDNRVLTGSNPVEAVLKLLQFLYPTLPVFFGRDTKSRWSLLAMCNYQSLWSKHLTKGVNV